MKKFLLFIISSVFLFMLGCNAWIIFSTKNDLIYDSRELLGAEMGLVFGTSQYLMDGDSNPFFKNRIVAAGELIKSGKVERLILSGSKDSIYYNESVAMRKALLKLGISSDKLILDPLGDRSIISIARLKNIHHIDQCIFVTQKYHAYRVLFIANYYGIDAQCYVAESPDHKEHWQTLLRELFARTKAVIELYIFNEQSSEVK